MDRRVFDRYVTAEFPEVRKYAEKKSADDGNDILHDGFVSLYGNKTYVKVKSNGNSEDVRKLIVTAFNFAFQHSFEAGGRYKNQSVNLEEAENVEEEYNIELIADVRNAIGKLSLEHQNLIKAHFYDGSSLREIASNTGETTYRIFTELEIAKAYLRTFLADYRPRKCATTEG